MVKACQEVAHLDLEQYLLNQSDYDSLFSKRTANIVFFYHKTQYIVLSSNLNDQYLKCETYSNVADQLAKSRKI